MLTFNRVEKRTLFLVFLLTVIVLGGILVLSMFMPIGHWWVLPISWLIGALMTFFYDKYNKVKDPFS